MEGRTFTNYHLAPHVTRADTEYGCVLLNTRSGIYTVANLTATNMIDLLTGDMTRPQIVAELMRRYGVALEVLTTDLDSLIGTLQATELLDL
jgi:hypothetical protein